MTVSPEASRPTTCAACTRRSSTPRAPGASAPRSTAAARRSPAGRRARPAAVVARARRRLRGRRRGRRRRAVTDFGMVPTEMLYYGVADRGLDGGAAGDGLAQPAAVQRHEARRRGRAAALRRRRHSRAQAPRARHATRLRPPARPHVTTDDLYPDYVEHLLAQVDAGALRRTASSWTPPTAPPASSRRWSSTARRSQRIELYFEVDGSFPNHEPNPLLEENSRELRERVRGRRRRPGHRLGRRRRPLLLHRRERRVRARRLRHGAARRGAACSGIRARRSSTTCAPAGPCPTPSGPTAACRSSTASGTPSSSSACGASRCCSAARSRATTTSGQLQRRLRLHPGAAHPRAAVAQAGDDGRAARAAALCATSSRERSTPRSTTCRRPGAHRAALRRRRRLASRRRLGRLPRLALQRAALEHRAAGAPQPRGDERGADGGEARPGAVGHPPGRRLVSEGSAGAGPRVARAELGPERVAELDAPDSSRPSRASASSSKRATPAPWRRSPASASSPTGRPDGVVVCGMGGSAIGGDVVARLPRRTSPVPYEVVRGYELPAWVSARTLVVAVSYSGNTEETLSCVARALPRGCRPVCVASGGVSAALAAERDLPLVPCRPACSRAPRSAIWRRRSAPPWSCAGLAPGFDEQVAEAIAVAARARQPSFAPTVGDDDNVAKSVARRLLGRLAVVYGARRHGAGGAALEDAAQRERQDTRPSSASCPSSTTTRSPAGRRTPALAGAPSS